MSFIEAKQPFLDNERRKVCLRAPEVTWGAGRNMWDWGDRVARAMWVDKKDFQVAILGQNGDAASSLSGLLLGSGNNINRPMHVTERRYPDGEIDLITIDEREADSTYVVASITGPEVVEDVCKIADHCRNTLGSKQITGVFPFLGGTRQDKNVILIPESERGKHEDQGVEVYEDNEGLFVYEPRPLTVRTRMKTMSQHFDRLIVVEPHSSAAQYWAYRNLLPVAPVTPALWMAGEFLKNIDLSKWIAVRPDEGRNTASERMAKEYGLETAAASKLRVGNGKVKLKIRSEDFDKINGKHCLAFDDEIASAATYKYLGEALQEAGAVDLTALYVHAKFVGDWYKNLGRGFVKQVIGTNSRIPIGPVSSIGDMHSMMPMEEFILDLINADVRGVNFWDDSEYRKMILQEQPKEAC